MREILFRGKRVDNGEWVYGNLYITKGGEYEIAGWNAEFDVERYTYVVIPETVGQYTGLTDENGVKIFEGDVVRYKRVEHFGDEDAYTTENYEYFIKPVVFKNGEFTPREMLSCCEDFWFSFGCIDFEIIGNIHDNPELLKGDETNG